MRLEQEALQFASFLTENYFVNRDMDLLLDHMDEHVTWLGTGIDEISHNLTEATIALYQDKQEYSGSFTLSQEALETQLLSETTCLVYGSLHARPDHTEFGDLYLHLSMICQKTASGMKLLHCNFSYPDANQEQNHCYTPRYIHADNQKLRHALKSREQQLEHLMKHVPGGTHQCANDPYLTLLGVSDSFYSMFGFSPEEIHTRFQDRYLNMIDPRDRDAMMQEIAQQLANGPTLELEYRVLCRDRDPIWILDKGRLLDDQDGQACFYCILIEITDRKREQEELRLSLERHEVIMDQTTDIIFEWDINKDTLLFSPNWRKKFGYDPIQDEISQNIPLSANIHPNDRNAFVKIMQDTAAGIPYSETEFRICNRNNHFIWCQIRATTQYDSNHRPLKAVGVIIDISAQKEEKQQLLSMAQKDPLTSLYNKTALKQRIEQRIPLGQNHLMHALLIIDIDNFKSVNDTYGHLSGDYVLSEVARMLLKQFRTSDILGRIGGDEFLVYLPEIQNKAAAAAKITALLQNLKTIHPSSGAPSISCSIGAALFPQGTGNYLKLYQCADQALYQQKDRGKNGITFYQN